MAAFKEPWELLGGGGQEGSAAKPVSSLELRLAHTRSPSACLDLLLFFSGNPSVRAVQSCHRFPAVTDSQLLSEKIDAGGVNPCIRSSLPSGLSTPSSFRPIRSVAQQLSGIITRGFFKRAAPLLFSFFFFVLKQLQLCRLVTLAIQNTLAPLDVHPKCSTLIFLWCEPKGEIMWR